jgi:hypothetical protein
MLNRKILLASAAAQPSPAAPDLLPAALPILAAAKYAGLNRSAIYAAIGKGRLKAIKHDRRTLILRADLDRMLAELPRAPIRGNAAA